MIQITLWFCKCNITLLQWYFPQKNIKVNVLTHILYESIQKTHFHDIKKNRNCGDPKALWGGTTIV